MATTILGMSYVPSTEDLLRVMTILGVPGDPLTIMKDHTEERRRAELLAYVAAAVTEQCGAAESEAGLGVDDKVDLHWQADRAVARDDLLALERTRLAWVHHALVRTRGPHQDCEVDTAIAALGAIIQLLETMPAGRPEPILADALEAFRADALRLTTALRFPRRPIEHV
jgi:hypothetical protein